MSSRSNSRSVSRELDSSPASPVYGDSVRESNKKTEQSNDNNESENTVMIKNLSFNVTADHLREIVGNFATVVSAKVESKTVKDHLEHIGTVSLESHSDAELVIKYLNQSQVDGMCPPQSMIPVGLVIKVGYPVSFEEPKNTTSQNAPRRRDRDYRRRSQHNSRSRRSRSPSYSRRNRSPSRDSRSRSYSRRYRSSARRYGSRSSSSSRSRYSSSDSYRSRKYSRSHSRRYSRSYTRSRTRSRSHSSSSSRSSRSSTRSSSRPRSYSRSRSSLRSRSYSRSRSSSR